MKKFFYRVKDDDTIFSIALKFSVPVVKLIKENNLSADVCSGDVLCIEQLERTLYRVKPFETEISIGQKFNVPPEKILSDNGVDYLFYGLVIVI